MSITEDIWNVLRTDLAIQKDLERGLINHRALARYVLKNYPIKASMESAISAIRRFKSDEIFENSEKELLSNFKEASIKTRSNIACLTLKTSVEKILPGFLLEHPDSKRVTGSDRMKLLVEDKILAKAEKAFKSHIIKMEKELGELSIVMTEKACKTRGVLARVADEISLYNINIEEMIICPPEFLIYVKQKDIIKTYDSLLKLKEKGI
jgi:hypothetical protein